MNNGVSIRAAARVRPQLAAEIQAANREMRASKLERQSNIVVHPDGGRIKVYEPSTEEYITY